MIDWDSLATAARFDTPFSWIKVRASFKPDEARRLAASFPEGGFSQSIGKDGRYRLAERTVVEGNIRKATDDLAPEWGRLVDDFLSERYHAVIQQMLGFQFESSALRVRLYRYGRGDWMMPHTDPPDRLTTHLIYLSEGWREQYGGELLLLNSGRKEDICEVLAPEFNSAVLFRPSEKSHHAVRPVQAEGSWVRLVIIAQFISQSARM